MGGREISTDLRTGEGWNWETIQLYLPSRPLALIQCWALRLQDNNQLCKNNMWQKDYQNVWILKMCRLNTFSSNYASIQIRKSSCLGVCVALTSDEQRFEKAFIARDIVSVFFIPERPFCETLLWFKCHFHWSSKNKAGFPIADLIKRIIFAYC